MAQVDFEATDSVDPTSEHEFSIANDESDLTILTDYERDRFFARLEQIVLLTGGYGGTLGTTWEGGETLEASEYEVSDQTQYNVNPQHKSQLEILVSRVKNSGISRVVIEAAHVYVNEDIEDPVVRDSVIDQFKTAAVVTKMLKVAGIDSHQILFIDDYNVSPDSQQLDVDHFLDLAHMHGYSPELLLREKNMVPLARQIIAYMKDNQNLVDEIESSPLEDGSSLLKGRGVENDLKLKRKGLELYRADDDRVSCAMLDAALSVVKFRYFGGGILNILPRSPGNGNFSYKGQQKKTRTIIGEHLGVYSAQPFFNIFINTDGIMNTSISSGAHNELRKSRS